MLEDCGFDVTVSLGAMQATLHLPAFTKRVMSAAEVEQTRTIANVHTHVECVVSSVHVQQRFPILQSTYNCRLIFDQTK